MSELIWNARLDRLSQRICDDLDALLQAVGLNIAILPREPPPQTTTKFSLRHVEG